MKMKELEIAAYRALAAFYEIQADTLQDGDCLGWRVANRAAVLHFLEDLYEPTTEMSDAVRFAIYAMMLDIASGSVSR